jgi:dTDP-glucose pyrophosphorylase
MAGLNTRFHDVGFDIPKYLLPWKDKTIIYEILKTFTINYKFNNILLIAHQRDIYFKDQLANVIAPLNLSYENLYYIGDTQGQADTASVGAKLFENNKYGLCIHNADTIISGINFNQIEELLQTNDAFIDIFTANSKKYCYVRTEANIVKEIKEKEIISPYATSGLYVFKNSKFYLDSYHKTLDKNKNTEMYVSEVFKNLIQDNKKITVNKINHQQDILVLGTPEEYGLEVSKLIIQKNE